MPIRFIVLPALVSLAALVVAWRYVRGVLRPVDVWERDPVGPTEDVVSALGRVTTMKISTEAEALAYSGGKDG